MAEMSTKKICLVITKGNWGGAQKYVYNLAVNLPKESYERTVICGEGGALKAKLEEAGVKVVELPDLRRDMSLWREAKSFWHLLKTIRKESPDILHSNSPKAGGLGALAGRIIALTSFLTFSKYRGPRCIYTAHGWTFNENRGALQTILITFFSWLTIILNHKTIVIAPREEKQALDLPFIKSKKIELIPNGIEPVKFFNKAEAREKLLSLSGKKESSKNVWLGTIAELHKNKGLSYAIEALSKIDKPYLFFIVGEGEEKERLRKIIDYYGLGEKIFLTGFMENAGQFLKAFDIYLCASVKEGLPYTILEAGLAGLPVVSTSVGGIQSVIENGVSGILVTKQRSGEITRALEYLLENPSKKKILGQNLKEKVEKEFSLEKMLEKTIGVYDH